MSTEQQLEIVTKELEQLVASVGADQLDNATPCAKWQVRDLIAHLVGGLHFFAAQLEGAPAAPPQGDPLGDDPLAAYQAAAEHFRAAMRHPEAPERTISLGFGDMPGSAFLKLGLFDLLVHAWDLSTATGQHFQPDPEAVADADAFARGAIPPEARDGDAFGAEVEATADATPLERLVAFSGRRPQPTSPFS